MFRISLPIDSVHVLLALFFVAHHDAEGSRLFLEHEEHEQDADHTYDGWACIDDPPKLIVFESLGIAFRIWKDSTHEESKENANADAPIVSHRKF